MLSHNGFTKRWNIFARELEQVLANHNIQLAYMHEEIPIFPDKVRRLMLSLSESNSFPVLREDELELLVNTCHLSAAEVLQLRAALLATSVEKTLAEHIDAEEALQAADMLLPTILADLQRAADEARANGRGDLFLSHDNTSIQVLEKAWRACDSAEIELQLSYNANSRTDRVAHARQAVFFYEEACTQMEQAASSLRAMRAWQDWYAELQRGRTAARARLETLER
jgi:hypothetical protein